MHNLMMQMQSLVMYLLTHNLTTLFIISLIIVVIQGTFQVALLLVIQRPQIR